MDVNKIPLMLRLALYPVIMLAGALMIILTMIAVLSAMLASRLFGKQLH